MEFGPANVTSGRPPARHVPTKRQCRHGPREYNQGSVFDGSHEDMPTVVHCYNIVYTCGQSSTRATAVDYVLLATSATVLMDRRGTVECEPSRALSRVPPWSAPFYGVLD
jgi:hypothetical protein